MRTTGSLRFVLLERERELKLLADSLAGVGVSGGKVVLVRGEAGVGKSTLVREFLAAHAGEAHVYVGFCDDLLTPQPLGPLWDIAREAPSLLEPLEASDSRAAMGGALDLLSRALRPTVLVIEDTQWADEVTLDAVKYLGRRIGGTNGLLVLTYRDVEVDYDHSLRHVFGELAPEDLVRISLAGLSRDAVASMVEGTRLDEGEVFELTDGNPLFVGELVASDLEGVPASVRDSVLAMARKLTPKARGLLNLVSVIPGGAEMSLIEKIAEPTEELMTESITQGLLQVGTGTVSFRHELTRRAVESVLADADRRILNQRVLDELRHGEDLARIVHHAREARNVEAIVEFAPQAARVAMSAQSYDEAISHFETLEPYLDQLGEAARAGVLDDWARTQYTLEHDDAGLTIISRAIDAYRSTGNHHAWARALTFAARINENLGDPAAADSSIAEALKILESRPPSADLAFALGEQAWLAMSRSEVDRAMELSEQAMSMAEKVGDQLAFLHSLITKGTVLAREEDREGFDLLNEARASAKENGYRREELRACFNGAFMAKAVLDLPLADEMSQTAIDTAIQYEMGYLFLLGIRAEILMLMGNWVGAEDIVSELRGLDFEDHWEQAPEHVLWRLQTRKGLSGATSMLDGAWDAAEASGRIQNHAHVAYAVAENMWITDAVDPDRLADLHVIRDEMLRLWSGWEVGELDFYLWAVGEPVEIPDGIADGYRLVMQGHPAEAAEYWEGKGMPYEQAVALMHGDERARIKALDILEYLGATAVADKLKKGLRGDGIPIPRSRADETIRGGASLTTRQAEVLELLKEDLSNIEIADRLFLSPRTVEHHVAAIMSKLNASTRQEAVAVAIKHDVAQPP